MPAAMSEPLYGIVGIDQSETTRGIRVLRLAPERGEKREGMRRYRTFGSNKFNPSGIKIFTNGEMCFSISRSY